MNEMFLIESDDNKRKYNSEIFALTTTDNQMEKIKI